MKLIQLLIASLIISAVSHLNSENQAYEERKDVLEFIQMMHQKHGFNKEELLKLFSEANFQEKVVRIMNKQPESIMPWYRYKQMMITPHRINSGRNFIESYRKELNRAEEVFGVPAEIIASIIGIETSYGKIKGNIRVIDSLTTLSFDYPRRSKFFKVQLEEFLLLTREEGLNVYKIKGSIAGAMGYGQFMPDSYRDYAIDFDFDGKRDILESPIDAIGSVANFLSKKGKWQPNTGIAIKAKVSGESPKFKSAFKPYVTVSDLKKYQLEPLENIQSRIKVVPIELEVSDGFEYWLGLNNFYALSRYNRSKLYIMAVFEFSKSLSDYL